MMPPAIGPTIGGYLTENWGWQYIFYVNLVPGAVMVAMLFVSLEASPMRLTLPTSPRRGSPRAASTCGNIRTGFRD